MKLHGTCGFCKGGIETEATPLPKDQTEGQEGIFEYDMICPHCGQHIEGVLKARTSPLENDPYYKEVKE